MKEKLKKWMPIAIPLALLCGLCYLVGILCHIVNLPQSKSVYDEFSGTKGTLWSNKSYYEEGEPIHIRFTVENTSDEPILLEKEEVPVVDIDIHTHPPSATRLYRWSEMNPDEAALLHQLELQPGEKYEIELTFTDYGYPPGLVSASWRADDIWQSIQLELWFGPFDRFIPPLP